MSQRYDKVMVGRSAGTGAPVYGYLVTVTYSCGHMVTGMVPDWMVETVDMPDGEPSCIATVLQENCRKQPCPACAGAT